MDTIVVFGRLPDKAYLPLQLAMASKRMRPKIVRFDPNETYKSASDAVPSADSLAGLDDDEADKRYEQYVSEAFTQTFVSSEMVASVKAVVLPESNGDSSQYWEWALERLPEAASCYTAHKSESDNSFWLSGARDDRLVPVIEYYSNLS